MTVAAEIAALQNAPTKVLVARYRELFGKEPRFPASPMAGEAPCMGDPGARVRWVVGRRASSARAADR